MDNVPEPFGPIEQSFVWHSSKKITAFHLIDQQIDRNEEFVAVGNFINSQGRRFSESERSNLDNLKLELA